jgi:DMSO/TMAO reductase YedYZ heme-binding membrane subunit
MAEEREPTPPQRESLSQELWRKKFYIAKAFIIGMVFWAVYFALQYYWLSPGNLQSSIVRGSALLGATTIGLALLIGPFSRIFPKYNYIRLRRTVGVLGFTFIAVHVLSSLVYVYSSNLGSLVTIFNPYENPVVFALIAFVIYTALFLTSTNWATNKLTFPVWKALHRTIYVAWILSVLHFVLMNPPLLLNPLGYILLGLTVLVFAFQIAAFTKHARTHREDRRARLIGYSIIVLGLGLFYYGYKIASNQILYWLEAAVLFVAAILMAYDILRERKNASSQDSTEASPN